jgi:eukaryotic-like serine/threonine-protein kinase
LDIALLKPGDRVSEYVLIERVGRGGFGDVWKARHHVWPDRIVAVKMPATAERANLLKREGVLQDRVRHPNAVDVLGMDPDHDPPYLIMEFVEGESLRARLQRETRLAPGVAVDLGVQILGALEHAHARGVVHRDLKPENILIAKDGLAKLTDFGLGRLLEDARAKLAVSGSLISTDGRDISGTVAYMAPEQREAGRTVDARADLYAFGIVLFEMLTGARPEGGEAPADLVAGRPPRRAAGVRHC